MAIDSALQYHLNTVENLILQSTSSIPLILTKKPGRHDSHGQKKLSRSPSLALQATKKFAYSQRSASKLTILCFHFDVTTVFLERNNGKLFFVMLSYREAVPFRSQSLMKESDWFKPTFLERFADEVVFSLRSCFESICVNMGSSSQNGYIFKP